MLHATFKTSTFRRNGIIFNREVNNILILITMANVFNKRIKILSSTLKYYLLCSEFLVQNNFD